MKITDVKKFLEANQIRYQYEGDPECAVDGFCPLNSLKNNAITWVRNIADIHVDELNSYNDLLLVAELGSKLDRARFPVFYVENAHRTFFRIVQHFFSELDQENRKPGIASTAVVESERVGSDLSVGHHTYIGPDVEIGDHVTMLHHVTIQGRVSIGDNTVIESGTTIGACGFGHYKGEDGNPVCVPHLGGVRIGAHVKIGANNAISRGCLADTVIEDFVKTDNLCHIAHNDYIKRGAMLTAGVVISGSTTVGENAWLAPGTLLNNSIEVGRDAYTGIGAVATKDIPEGKVVVGLPARELRNRF